MHAQSGEEEERLSSLAQANAQGIVMGNQIKRPEGGGGGTIMMKVKSIKNFLPELSTRRQSNHMEDEDPKQMAYESEIRQKSAEPLNTGKPVAVVADQAVEIDSILSPDYLKLVSG